MLSRGPAFPPRNRDSGGRVVAPDPAAPARLSSAPRLPGTDTRGPGAPPALPPSSPHPALWSCPAPPSPPAAERSGPAHPDITGGWAAPRRSAEGCGGRRVERRREGDIVVLGAQPAFFSIPHRPPSSRLPADLQSWPGSRWRSTPRCATGGGAVGRGWGARGEMGPGAGGVAPSLPRTHPFFFSLPLLSSRC